MRALTLALMTCVLISGCSGAMDGAVQTVNHPLVSGVQPKEQTDMDKCTLLGTVQASSATSNGWFEAAKTADGITNAERQARAMGATNVVWKNDDLQLGNGNAQGQAYKCQ